MVFHIQPVTNIQTFPVNRQRFVSQCIGNHQRNQLLREVIRTIVVGATRNRHRQTIGTMVSQNQQIGRSLRAAVRRAGMNRSLFGEEQVRAIQRKVTINLIRRNLMITLDAIFTASVHQYRSADNIGLEEDTRIFNGTINMRFCRKVDHDIRMLLLEQLIDCFTVADVCFHKAEIGVIHNRCQRGQVSCISQLVQADDPVIRILLQHMENKIGTDESGTAGNNDSHLIFTSLNIEFFHPQLLSNAFHTDSCRIWMPIPVVFLWKSSYFGMQFPLVRKF